MSGESTYLRSRELLSCDDSRLLIVDVQEIFVPVIPGMDSLIANCVKLLAGADILGVPASATEQYPKGLGLTVPELRTYFESIPEKLRFSSAECVGWSVAEQDDRFKVVVAGIETHVCIQQTALDLIAAGYQVYLPADALASQRTVDHEVALQRLRDSGAVITTTEAILFEWCEVAGTDEFKQISRLVTGR